jgi:glucosamine-6-phosphate deaminase
VNAHLLAAHFNRAIYTRNQDCIHSACAGLSAFGILAHMTASNPTTNSIAVGRIDQLKADHLHAHIYESRGQMGAAAATAVAAEMRRLIAERGRAVGIFASAPSQNEFLDALVQAEGIEWTRVIGFHLDEYLGMEESAPQSFRKFLLDRLVRRVPMAEFHGLRGEAANPEAVCANYAVLLRSRPPDFAVLGVGENGHLAFIDPPVCDFNDKSAVKIVELDGACRRQQVHDGAFAKLEDVPRHALSLTIPTILSCERLFAIVPGARKQQAVRDAIEGTISESCPASILRTHPNAHLFLDREAAALLSR